MLGSIEIIKSYMHPIYETWLENDKLMQKVNGQHVEVITSQISHNDKAAIGAIWVEGDKLCFVDINRDIRQAVISWRD